MHMVRRIERVSELMRREIAMIVAREVGIRGVLITLTRVEISLDLQYGNIYFTTIPEEAAEKALGQLTQNIFPIQQALNRRLRMRPVPKIRFLVDGAEQEAAKIDEIIHTIDEANYK